MKYLIILIALIALGTIAYFALGGPAAEPVLAPTQEEEEQLPVAEPQTLSSGTTVTYSDQGFSPSQVTVSVGDTVRFVNQSSREMWVGVDEHPTHTKYDGTSKNDHCPGTTAFDQCARSGPGTSWEYTFTKTGTFGYHNHAGAADVGVIVVQ
ncbi:MAG: plastocyanin/azurin family copper-binding protein [Patescibacteria group bacterium]